MLGKNIYVRKHWKKKKSWTWERERAVYEDGKGMAKLCIFKYILILKIKSIKNIKKIKNERKRPSIINL